MVKLLSGDLHLFMRSLLAAPSAKLLQLDFPLHLLFVLAGVVISVVAHAALEPYEIVGIFNFRHCAIKINKTDLICKPRKNVEPEGRIELPTSFLP